MLTSALSNQTGAAFGAHAFDAITPAGVVAVRQLMTAAVLVPAVRPRVRRFTRAQWWPVLLLSLAFSTMNLTLYLAIDRIGLGLAVTLEFLGPLAVALATARRRIDLALALAAGAGVYVLVLPDGSTDVLGVGSALLAAGCWASYILLNRTVGRRLPGLQGTAAASFVSAALFVPVTVAVLLITDPTPFAIGCAVVAGLLASVVPLTVDLTTLRHVPARFFAIFMSVHPVLAALVGLVALQQALAWHEVAGIAVIVVANVVAVATTRNA